MSSFFLPPPFFDNLCLLGPHKYLDKEDRYPQDECGDPCSENGLLGLADRAEILGPQRMHDGVVPGNINEEKLLWSYASASE